MKLTFLGTGTSVGVPTIGCTCRVCSSTDPHDKRLRASVLVESGDTRVLVDCGPDFRQQMLGREFKKIDAVLLTHEHYDHVGGIDDLRPFCTFGEVDVYADGNTVGDLRRRIPYCFGESKYPGVPKINLSVVEPHRPFSIGSIDVLPIQVMHGKLPILGYRFGDLVYITDMKTIRKEEMEYLKDVKILIVTALRFSPKHHSHMTVNEAMEFIRMVSPEKTYFTHMGHDIGLHEEVNRQLPDDMDLAYDGQMIEF